MLEMPGNVFSIEEYTNQAIDINTLRATSELVLYADVSTISWL
jgi:hypothetical protein